MAPHVIEIDTSDQSDMFSSVFGKRIDEQVYSSFLEKYNNRPESPDDELEIVLTTEGGDMTYSVLVANILANHKGKTTAVVPKYAFSGGTVIALMCDEIHLCPNASLGPIDLQVYLPVKSVLPSMEKWAYRSWFCSAVHGLLSTCQKDYIDKLTGLFELKYKDSVVVKDMIDFFYFKYNHSTPLFQRDMPDFLAHKVKTVDVKIVKVAKQAVNASSDMDFMMRLMSASNPRPSKTVVKQLHGPSVPLYSGSGSDSDSCSD